MKEREQNTQAAAVRTWMAGGSSSSLLSEMFSSVRCISHRPCGSSCSAQRIRSSFDTPIFWWKSLRGGESVSTARGAVRAGGAAGQPPAPRDVHLHEAHAVAVRGGASRARAVVLRRDRHGGAAGAAAHRLSRRWPLELRAAGDGAAAWQHVGCRRRTSPSVSPASRVLRATIFFRCEKSSSSSAVGLSAMPWRTR